MKSSLFQKPSELSPFFRAQWTKKPKLSNSDLSSVHHFNTNVRQLYIDIRHLNTDVRHLNTDVRHYHRKP